MKILSWQKGRQGTGYSKMLLVVCPFVFPFDLYLLRYPVGAFIPPHTDPVAGRNHYRLNVELVASGGGGFVCNNCIARGQRWAFFRPDKSVHSVSRIEGRTRYVLSFGFLWGKSN